MADPTADGVCYGLQDLVVSPAVAHLTKGIRTAAKNMLKMKILHRYQAGHSTFPIGMSKMGWTFIFIWDLKFLSYFNATILVAVKDIGLVAGNISGQLLALSFP